MPPLHRLCVYAGSSVGVRPEYAVAATALAEGMAARDIGLVFGGGRIGLMGVLADAILAAGGEAIGVMPRALVDREHAHTGLSELTVVDSMHERKALMAELADGFVAVPGGIGTLEELIEVFTWSQLGIHAKPCGVLDVADFYSGLSRLLDHMVREGFLRAGHRNGLVSASDPEVLLDRLHDWEPVTVSPAAATIAPRAIASPTDIRPPFTAETAAAKVQAAEDAWNSRDPDRVALAYTEDSEWRNRDEFLHGRDEIRAFLGRKWGRELEYRLKKSLWAFGEDRIAVRFEYECRDADGQWWRSYGNENWEFDATGLMSRRYASINDVRIDASERRIATDVRGA